MLHKVGAALIKHIQPLVSSGSSDSVEKRDFVRFQPEKKKGKQDPPPQQQRPELKVILGGEEAPPSEEERAFFEAAADSKRQKSVSVAFLDLMGRIKSSTDLLTRLFGARAYRSRTADQSEIQKLPKGTILDREK